MEIAIEQHKQTPMEEIFDFEFNPADCFEPTDEQLNFILSKSKQIENYYINHKKFDKENNTVYGLPVEVIPFTYKPNKEQEIKTRAVKIGYIYFMETKNVSNGWNWTGLTCEEIIEEIFNNPQIQQGFDIEGLYFGYGFEGRFCVDRNLVRLFKESPGQWWL